MAQTQPQRINVPRVTVNGPPTAWESIPKLIRFVAWVIAILTLLSLAGALLFGLVFVLILGASL